ncbi:hypothetical protein IU459_36460 [Nocardia amamiensis]|uniref:Uncharacterized protein n=1 Tax=Nocardia amamiensis TaxID=404578 RepID=A0ABS0D2T9_9NOCA|nr:AAA family ATPase [Nocardia amamiensis]MBF6302966.1 hypothetical protein [Nocardia amamiensis]
MSDRLPLPRSRICVTAVSTSRLCTTARGNITCAGDGADTCSGRDCHRCGRSRSLPVSSGKPKRCPMLIWLNGPFGAGQAAVAAELAAMSMNSAARVFEPEHVGSMLRELLWDVDFTDFQRSASWRRLVPLVTTEVAEITGQDLIVVQPVLVEDCWAQITEGCRARGYPVRHVVLESSPDTLRQRIREDRTVRGAIGRRMEHTADYVAARDAWLANSADLIINTTDISARQTAELIADAMRGWSKDKGDNRDPRGSRS